MSGRVEFRVRWRRPAWSHRTETKSRTFSRKADAARFAARLEAWGDIEFITIDERPVGDWREVA